MDVFHFTAASEPAPRDCSKEVKWSGKPSAKRRKVCSAMDPSYLAHVVRVVEPTAITNDFSPLPSQYLDVLLDAGYFPTHFSLPPDVFGEITTTTATAKPLEHRPFDHAAAEDNAAVRHADDDIRSSAPSHPRPESDDLLAEEDGRRIRYALPDDDDSHVERLSRHFPRNDAARPPSPSLGASVHGSNVRDDLWPPLTTVSTPSDGAEAVQRSRPASEPRLETYEFPLPPPPPLPFLSRSQLLWDDNVLAVDDHLRDFDFADFMDHWRLRASNEADIPAFTPAAGPSPWRKPGNQYVRHRERTGRPRDLQGIDWETIGVERRSALEARRLLHPDGISDSVKRRTSSGTEAAAHYTPRAFAPTHRARFSHYQLRNVMASSTGRDVYYAAGSHVYQASLASPSTKQNVMNLAKPSRSAAPFKVTCVATKSTNGQCNDDVLFAGGFNGEYAMLNLNAAVHDKPAEGVVSHARDGIVNHISLFGDRQSGSPRAAFCSNDQRVRLMDVRRQQFTNVFEYESAINCAAISPDRRLRALVHDGPDSWITNAETGEILFKLDAHTDFAFACDWSSCGRYIATGAEDQQVVVWDARNWSRPLHKLDCVMSCARSLHFTDDGSLVIAESEDVVSIVDTKTFSLRQDIRFFGSIPGVSLMDGGAELVVANADTTVGGLMSFTRVAKGRGNGGFGHRSEHDRVYQTRWRQYESAAADDVLV